MNHSLGITLMRWELVCLAYKLKYKEISREEILRQITKIIDMKVTEGLLKDGLEEGQQTEPINQI